MSIKKIVNTALLFTVNRLIEILATGIFIIGVLLLLALIFYSPNDPNFIFDITSECLEMFGDNRCIFGSNYPIEKIWSDYDSIVNAFVDSTAKLSSESQLKIMKYNAEKFYNLG